MKIRINEDTYDLQSVIDGASLGSLRTLKLTSGESVKTIAAAFAWAAELPAGQANGRELFDNAGFIGAVIAIIFLARRSAGEQVTWDQAADLGQGDFAFIEDEDVPANPKDEADSPSELVPES